MLRMTAKRCGVILNEVKDLCVWKTDNTKASTPKEVR